MRARFLLPALLLAGGVLPGTASADETTFCNAYVTSLPYTITTQGHYCFNQNLSTAMATGSAITVDSDFVVLDLNGFKLGGGSAGLGTLTDGINTHGHANVTIRGGNVRGFYIGVHVSGGANARNNRVEKVTADGNTYVGIMVEAPNHGGVVQDCTVLATGGSTQPVIFAVGIWNDQGFTSITRNNTVSGTFFPSFAVGILGGGWVLHNVVTGDGSGLCFYNGDFAVFRDNEARDCASFYQLGTNAGGNYP